MPKQIQLVFGVGVATEFCFVSDGVQIHP